MKSSPKFCEDCGIYIKGGPAKKLCSFCAKKRRRVKQLAWAKKNLKSTRVKKEIRRVIDFDCFGNMENTIYL